MESNTRMNSPLSTIALSLALVLLAGCEGDDGKDGAQGPQGPQGVAGADGAPVLMAQLVPMAHRALKVLQAKTAWMRR
jgi:hypothetical protein